MKTILLRPNEEDLVDAHALEVEYSNLAKYGGEDGFFIKTEKISLYNELNELGCVWVAKLDNKVIGQYVIIPPDHTIMHRLFDSGCMDFFVTADLSPANCYWLAKIAVNPEHTRLGVGSQMVEHMINNNKNYNLLTTTALTPVTNQAIAGLVGKSGLQKIGVWVSGPENQLTCNYLWLFAKES